MSRPSTFRHFSAVSLLAIVATFSSTAALAQNEAQAQQSAAGEGDEEIIITGSRIPPRAGFDTVQPAVVLGGDQIETRGYTNLGEALDELPQFGVPGNNAVGTQTGAFGAGQTFVNFFGLGSQRTLTIVNNRRFVSSNTSSIFGPTGAGSQVDFNVIPSLIIDRIETIAVGGAPIYGSDAIAGTVNLITKNKFEGIQLDAQQGISQRGDAYEYRLGAVAGQSFSGGRGHAVVAFEYNKAKGLTGRSRPNAGLGRFFTDCLDTSVNAQCLIQDRALPSISSFGIPALYDFIVLSPSQAANDYAFLSPYFGAPPGTPFQPGITDANGNPLAFDASGNLVPIDFGTATGNLLNFDGGSGFRLPENLLTETRRILGVGLAEFQVTDNVRIFGEAWYANSRGNQLRDQPVYNNYLFGSAGEPDGNIIISLNNPFLNPQARATIEQNLNNSFFTAAPPGTFFLGRANTDIIPSDGFAEVELYRFVGGVDGNFNALDREFTYQVVGNYGRSKTQGKERVLIQQNFENAINAVAGPNGSIICAPGFTNSPIASISSTCAPLNPFGQQISQAAIDYVTTFADPRAVNKQWMVTATLAGSLFDLPGGPADFVLGYEHRKESADFDPGVFYFGQVDPLDPTGPRTQYGRSIPIDFVSGSFNTDEFFAELKLPIVGPDQDISFIHLFEISGAARYISHSLAGGDWTYTAGARWAPVRDITFRGNYTRSVRSPAITELFNPTSEAFDTADDPCDQAFIGRGPDPANRAANCAADGITQPFNSNIVDATASITVSGNPNLANETAKSWTAGVIIRPSFVSGLTLSADWVSIKLKNAIEALSAQNILEACYDSPDFPNAISASGTNFCDAFTRNAQNQVTFVATGFENAASTDFSGLMAELQWRFATPFLGAASTVNVGVNYLYNNKLETRVGLGDLTTLNNSIGYSKHQATTNVTYNNKRFTGQVQVQWIGPAKFNPDEPADNRDFPGVGGVAFVNTSVQYRITDDFTLRFIIENLFDQSPPFPSPGGGGRVTYFDGILGRYFKVGAKFTF